ncbi:hypothetical protein QN415_20615, partial [Pseudomonas sp. 5S4]
MHQLKRLLEQAKLRVESPLARKIAAWVLLPLVMVGIANSSRQVCLATLDLLREQGWKAWPFAFGCLTVVV